MIDPTYTADALAWLLAWGALGVAGRVLVTRADRRRANRSEPAGRVTNVR
jgi:hypothetical protein